MPGNLRPLHKLPDLRHILLRQLHIPRIPVLLEVLDPLGAGDGNHIIPLLQQPGQRELGGGAAVLGRHVAEMLDDLDVVPAVLVGEAGQGLPAHVGVVHRGVGEGIVGERGRDHAAAEGHGGDDGDAQLAAGGEEVGALVGLDVEDEGGVVDLDGVDGGDLDGAADGGGGDAGEAEVLDLAFTGGLLVWNA